ncbi:hypothetical protein AMTRI_Chr02g256190 [Amborella trichopoda]
MSFIRLWAIQLWYISFIGSSSGTLSKVQIEYWAGPIRGPQINLFFIVIFIDKFNSYENWEVHMKIK